MPFMEVHCETLIHYANAGSYAEQYTKVHVPLTALTRSRAHYPLGRGIAFEFQFRLTLRHNELLVLFVVVVHCLKGRLDSSVATHIFMSLTMFMEMFQK